jgi:hypothetical protein
VVTPRQTKTRERTMTKRVDGGERLALAVEHDREVLERVVRVSDKMRLLW